MTKKYMSISNKSVLANVQNNDLTAKEFDTAHILIEI